MKTPLRGYTLVEAAMVVGIVGTLTALAMNGYERITARTRFSTSANQLLADLSNAKAKARSGEQRIVVVFLASTTNAQPGRYIVLQDNNRTFDLATYVPGVLPTGAKRINDVTFPSSAVTLETSTTRVRAALAAPFSAVKTTGGVTFAKAGFAAPYDLRGAITFQTDGRATFSDGATTGSIFLADAKVSARNVTIGIVGPTSTIRGF